MSISERKEREKKEKKQLILKAAIKIFMHEGWSNISIRKVAESIDYSPATIYLYFRDKDDLILAVKRKIIEGLNKKWEKGVLYNDPIQALENLGRDYIKFWQQNGDLYQLVFSPPFAREDSNDTLKPAFINCLSTIIKECMAQQRIRFNDRDIATQSILSFWHGILTFQVPWGHQGTLAPGIIAEELLSEYHRLIKR